MVESVELGRHWCCLPLWRGEYSAIFLFINSPKRNVEVRGSPLPPSSVLVVTIAPERTASRKDAQGGGMFLAALINEVGKLEAGDIERSRRGGWAGGFDTE